MHPLFNSNRSFLSLSILWTLLCVLMSFILLQLAQAKDAPIFWLTAFVQFLPWYFLLLFFSISNVYLCQRLPLDSTPGLALTLVQGLAACITIGLWLTAGWGWSRLLLQMGFSDAAQLLDGLLVYHSLFGLLVYGVWVMLHYSFLGATQQQGKNARQLEQQLMIKSIELQSLKATVHPHFMYNSLNMLANLSQIAPEQIHPLCVKMSEFLRYSVNHGKKPAVTLGEELKHAQNYLAIESARFGTRLNIQYDYSEANLTCPTLPLLLFPLVENAIKHGAGSQLETAFIHITLSTYEQWITVVIENSFDEQGIKPGTGHGLSNTRRRLQANYGDDARLSRQAKDGVFRVEIHLPPLPAARRLEAKL